MNKTIFGFLIETFCNELVNIVGPLLIAAISAKTSLKYFPNHLVVSFVILFLTAILLYILVVREIRRKIRGRTARFNTFDTDNQ